MDGYGSGFTGTRAEVFLLLYFSSLLLMGVWSRSLRRANSETKGVRIASAGKFTAGMGTWTVLWGCVLTPSGRWLYPLLGLGLGLLAGLIDSWLRCIRRWETDLAGKRQLVGAWPTQAGGITQVLVPGLFIVALAFLLSLVSRVYPVLLISAMFFVGGAGAATGASIWLWARKRESTRSID